MPQTKNADGFLHQRFCVPFTHCQALPALQRFTRSLLCFTRPQALKPFERCEATLERCVAALNS